VPALAKTTRPFYIVHADDEARLLGMVGMVIRTKFKNVTVRRFQNGDEAWEELLRADPDLLITDLLNSNVPGRTQSFGRSGYELLSLLTKRKAKYPILVLSGSLTKEGYESKVRQLAGSDLNISFLKKPFTTEQLYAELSKHIKPVAILEANSSESPKTSENTACFPNKIEFQIGGYHGESHKIIYSGAGKLEYRYADENYNWGEPVLLNPECALWEQFWRDLDSVGVWQWENSYRTSALDGTHWYLDLDFGEHSLHSKGDNAYPDSVTGDYSSVSAFAHFLTALEKLTGLKGIR